MFAQLLKGKKAVPVDHAAAILAKAQTKRSKASAHLERAERDFAAELLDGVLNVEEAQAFKSRKALDLARAEDSNAAQILEAAREIHSKALVADQAAKRKAQIAAIAGHLAQRDAVAMALGAAIGEACTQWRALLQHCDDAANVGIPLPLGGMVRLDELRSALAHELHRLGADPIHRARSFPGGHPSSLLMLDQPDAIEPLADVVKHASVHVLVTLNGDNHHA